MMNEKSTYEMVLWKAKDAVAAKETILGTANSALEKLEGFQERHVYRALNEGEKMLDWVAWDDLKTAESAAAGMKEVPELKALVGEVSELFLFEHFKLNRTHKGADAKGALKELVVYRLKESVDAMAFQDLLSAQMEQYPGYRGRYILNNLKKNNEWAEFVYWDSVEQALEAAAAMHQAPEMKKAEEQWVDAVLCMEHFNDFV